MYTCIKQPIKEKTVHYPKKCNIKLEIPLESDYTPMTIELLLNLHQKSCFTSVLQNTCSHLNAYELEMHLIICMFM